MRSEADYKEEARGKIASRKEEKKRQREQDKKLGIDGHKRQAREVLKASLRDHEDKFVQTVADALGWSPDDMRFPEEKFQNVGDAARKQAAQKHGRELLKRAKEAVEQQRTQLRVAPSRTNQHHDCLVAGGRWPRVQLLGWRRGLCQRGRASACQA